MANCGIESTLHQAALNNSIELFLEIIQRGADVNAVDKDGNAPLHGAAWINSEEIAAELIQSGADVNVVNKYGDTPLHWAAWNNSKETATELIQAGADVNTVNKSGNYNTPLHRAAFYNSKETAAELIQCGAHINAENKYGDTPLHWAAWNNSKETATELIQAGADVNTVNKSGNYNTPLHRAAFYNSKETAAELIQCGAHINTENKYGDTPLHCAAKNNSKETSSKLIQDGADVNAVNKDGDTPLHQAAKNNSTATAIELIQHGADVMAVNKFGGTPLHQAASTNSKQAVVELIQHGAYVNATNNNGDTPLHWAASNNRKETAAELIQHEALVNAVNKDGDIPLHWAAWNNSKEIAVELIQRGADVNAMNTDGNTPLHRAAWNNSKETAAELIHRGADINAVNKDADTPLHRAIKKKSKETAAELIRFLRDPFNNSTTTAVEPRQRGANVNAVNKYGDTPLHRAASNNNKESAAELIQRGADVNVVNMYGDTPLHWAAWINSKEAATELIQHGADINAVDKDGDTSLHIAAWINSNDAASELIQRGADANAVNKDGNTPLHLAIKENSKETAAELMQRGADFSAINKDGDTPLHLAIKDKSKETAAELIQRGADVNAVNKDGDTPLHLAALRNNKETAAELIQRGADYTITNNYFSTPLDIAFKMPNNSIGLIICQNIRSNLLSVNNFGQRGFHTAAKFCITEVLESQEFPGLSKQTVLDCRDLNGNSPLHCWATASCESEERKTKFGETIIQMGALVNARNNHDHTPLHVVTSWTAVDVLLEHGAWPNVISAQSGDTPLISRVKTLKESSRQLYEGFCVRRKRKTNCSSGDIKSASLIQEWQKIVDIGMDPWIANYNHESVLQLLLKKHNYLLAKAFVLFQKSAEAADRKHTNGETILHIICASDKDELQKTIDALLTARVDVNCTNSANETPLHLVCKRMSNISNTEDITSTMLYWTASRLLAYGADPNLQDSSDVSCYDIARGVPQLLDLLEQPIDITLIPPLLKWSEPKSEIHRHRLAQVVRNQKSFQIERFQCHKEPIGSGAFGHVFAGVDRRNGREIAVKRMVKERLVRPEDQREITNLVKLRDCDEVVGYLGHHEDAHFVFLILDLMEGTLHDYLDKTPRDVSLNVTLCRDIMKGLRFLHQNNVLHRDIKPGNILYKLSPRACLKLADFGLSAKAVYNTMSTTISVMYTTAGTRCWMAPELLKATAETKHSEASDVFACGLVLHFLLAEKRHPFTHPVTTARSTIVEQNETERNIMDYKPFLHKDLSPVARDLLETMLVEDKSKRPKAIDVLSHPFFWSEMKSIRFIKAVANQPEIEKPRYKVTNPSPVELQLENTLGNDFATIGWQNNILTVYGEMIMSGRRMYDTSSAVELVRFVRNCYAHVSHETRTSPVQKTVLKDCALFNKFPSLLIMVYKAAMTHGWDQRVEIQHALGHK